MLQLKYPNNLLFENLWKQCQRPIKNRNRKSLPYHVRVLKGSWVITLTSTLVSLQKLIREL